MQIVQGPPAELDPARAASARLRDFVATALVKERMLMVQSHCSIQPSPRRAMLQDPAGRPSAAEMLAHPFLRVASQGELNDIVQAQTPPLRRRRLALAEQHFSDGGQPPGLTTLSHPACAGKACSVRPAVLSEQNDDDLVSRGVAGSVSALSKA